MPEFAFQQVDVFGSGNFRGNPLAVVLGADGLSDAEMARFANWTNLSETAFIMRPSRSGADYRVRIFTPARELPFAGHPTLGSAHAWLAAGGTPRGRDVVQQCQVGLVPVRRCQGELAFAAPPLRRSGPVEPEMVERIRQGFGLEPGAVTAAEWVDNGPGWLALLLRSGDDVLAARPDYAVLGAMNLRAGLVGPWQDGAEAAFELRAFICPEGYEDPVTGSLNASVAQWLIGSGRAPESYVAAQGTALGRAGRVSLRKDGPLIWVGGNTVTCIEGRVVF
jgi:PhzF family phenazine biosynthesis protein